MGKSSHISENISKTQIVEQIFEAIKKSYENQKEQISEETLKKFKKESEKIGDTDNCGTDNKSEGEGSYTDDHMGEDDPEENEKEKKRLLKLKTKGKLLDIEG
ncbi:MAG: hypothetical protein JXR48_07960 [Candidatus Delongbacteria bacterium]|nr:hypothetical protein [Candidatus Delongbacteria bacterium]MBN2834887.1 hypothetical protein [Candidatus Delongbacteria bacterium]